ncbi:MAG: DUF2585 family protein [Sphingobium sp.]|nr:DUF2585 family protein [Sphingobium sp.]
MRGSAFRASGVIILVMAAVAFALHVMGRVWICTCGQVRLWAGGVKTPDNSQQLADWYSFSHIIHGMIFYALLRFALPKLAMRWRLLLAVIVECSWELLENSPIIIDRYRAATIAIGYTGDSVLNSMSDVTMMVIGFGLARTLPWKVTLGLALAMEMGTLLLIRDNLTLNVLMLAWPIGAIRHWQAAL